MLNVLSAMRRAFVLLLLIAASQAGDVKQWLRLRPVSQFARHDPSQRNPREWEDILASRHKTWPEDWRLSVRRSELRTRELGETAEGLSNRIIDGQTAARGQFPWQAHIVLGSSGLCGGSLISSIWILTAAICVSGFASYTVTVGATNLAQPETGSVSQTSRYWIMHSVQEGFFLQNDIAIIRLPSAVPSTEFISPVRLPRYSQVSESFAGQDAIVSGFGSVNSYNYVTSTTLQFSAANIISNDECFQFFPLDLQDVNICSMSSGSPCDGDTGGPLVVAEDDGLYTLVGVMSFNMLLCPLGVPTAFARVTSYLQWIHTYSGIAIRE